MESVEPPTELFRLSKRRKLYRKRPDNVTGDDRVDAVSSPVHAGSADLSTLDELIAHNVVASPPPLQIEDETSAPVADILRQRKAAQRRKGGIEFTNTTRPSATPQMSNELVEREDDGVPADVKSVISRFAPQTGQVSEDTDKHMMAYIESELAKRSLQYDATAANNSSNQILSANGALTNIDLHRQPATLGKLHEIDLGPDATLRNIARTQAAISGDNSQHTQEPQKLPKPRIGRNGKPYIPRPRPRRNSTDIARDRVVEQLLRETPLDIYDDAGTVPEGPGDDQAADDRIAEQFRRDFLEAIHQRRAKARHKPQSSGGGGKGKAVNERPKGPKLGGSRSARAAMREREEAAAKAAVGKARR
ncbi:MAG: hypothetical protein Q9217_004967 [Psora testacea]